MTDIMTPVESGFNFSTQADVIKRPARKLEAVLQPDYYADQRQALRSSMEKKGTILPPDHEFTQLIKKVSEKLGVPEDTDFLVVDSEEVEAFFHPKANTIGFTRGFCRFMMERGLPLTEDHIAAVLAHEIEHAAVMGDEYVNKVENEGLLQRVLGFQNHAEEMRADADGMKRMSDAGYNPNAMIELFRTLPMTLERNDIDHPEIIERIRYLESRVADDEHPLSHTTKDLTPIDSDLLLWLSGESDFYQRTEQLLHQSPDELKNELLKAKNQTEFWKIYQIQRHIEEVAVAKEVISKEDRLVEELFKKTLLYETLSRDFFINGNLFHESVIYYETKKKLQVELYSDTPPKAEKGFKSQVFRDVIPSIESGEILTDTRKKIQEKIQTLDKNLQDIFARMNRDELNTEQRQFFNHIEQCYSENTIDSDVLLTIFSSFDKTYQQKTQIEIRAKQREKGWRGQDIGKELLVDFSDDNERENFIKQTKIELVRDLVKLPVLDPQVTEHLTSIIISDTNLPPEAAKIIAETILLGQDAHPWVDYLKTQDKNILTQIIYGTQKITDNAYLELSPLRALHVAYQKSYDHRYPSHYSPGGEFSLDAQGLNALRMFPGRELYLRGYPEGYDLNFKTRLPPEQINLTLQEWNAVVDGQGQHGAWSERDIWVFQEYIKQVKHGQVDPELLTQIHKIHYIDASKEFNAEDLKTLIENSPWKPLELEKRIDAGIRTLPHEAETKEQRQELLLTLGLAYKLYSENPMDPNKTEWHDRYTTAAIISAHMLEVLILDKEAEGIALNQAVVDAVKQLTEQNIFLSYGNFPDALLEKAGKLTNQHISELIQFFESRQNPTDDQIKFVESMKMLSVASSEDRPEVAQQIISEKSLVSIINKQGDNAIEWVINNFQGNALRDVILIGLVYLTPEDLRQKYIDEVGKGLTTSPDAYKAQKLAFCSPILYRHYVNKQNKDNVVFFRGSGKLAENFDNLMLRRHPFATIGLGSKQFLAPKYWQSMRNSEFQGSPYQKFQARQLLVIEDVIFNRELPLEQRVTKLTETAPFPSVVRDIHIELMFREELLQAKDDRKKIEIGKKLLPLFKEKSSLKTPFAVQQLRLELKTDPSLTKDYNRFLPLLSSCLPEASLARNYFLTQFENSALLTPDKLFQLQKMRMSEEGKKEDLDEAPTTFLLNKLGERNREEKVATTLWLLGISPTKPQTIVKIETDYDGHLNSLPGTIMLQTDDEREVFFGKLLLGVEGIVDLEAVKETDLSQARSERRKFVEELSKTLLPDSMPEANLFRDIFCSIIESSDPAHASRIVIKLINKISEAKMDNKTLSPEEVIALGLNEIGVVGKKVSQSLAELDWVPDSYKKTLRKSQSEGEVVPKRALYTFAEDTGLFEERSPIRIVSFDDLIGAASNKQAALLTVEVNDETVGLPKGRHQVVGKFKRPSAQKTENIDHDLKVMRSILDILNQRGYAKALPRDFSAQISDAVKRELDFAQEKQFSEEIRTDLNSRNGKRKYKVTVPKVFFTSDDVMIESKAAGISLRNYQDLKQSNPHELSSKGYGELPEKSFNQTIVTEALAQLVNTGNIHADLHPGNIFIDQQGNLTFIDLGMHEKLNAKQRLNTISLIAGLATGNETYVKRALSNFGWNLGDTNLDLKKFNFSDNTMQILRASQKVKETLPEILGSVILATSKLGTYTKGFSNKELFKMLVDAVDKREVPRIIVHFVQSGKADFISHR